MHSKKTRLICVAIAVFAAVGFLGAWLNARGEDGALSEVPSVGGQWDHGASAGRTWSNFLHEKPHSASVQGHQFVDSGCVAGGEWAHVETRSKWVPLTHNQQGFSLCDATPSAATDH